jgi:hypothetical protein
VKELPPLSLEGALDMTMLIARKDPRPHPRVAARWLLRYLEESDDPTIDEAAMVATCLAALAGDRHRDAAQTLRRKASPEKPKPACLSERVLACLQRCAWEDSNLRPTA